MSIIAHKSVYNEVMEFRIESENEIFVNNGPLEKSSQTIHTNASLKFKAIKKRRLKSTHELLFSD